MTMVMTATMTEGLRSDAGETNGLTSEAGAPPPPPCPRPLQSWNHSSEVAAPSFETVR